jgi:hypothetical protein
VFTPRDPAGAQTCRHLAYQAGPSTPVASHRHRRRHHRNVHREPGRLQSSHGQDPSIDVSEPFGSARASAADELGERPARFSRMEPRRSVRASGRYEAAVRAEGGALHCTDVAEQHDGLLVGALPIPHARRAAGARGEEKAAVPAEGNAVDRSVWPRRTTAPPRRRRSQTRVPPSAPPAARRSPPGLRLTLSTAPATTATVSTYAGSSTFVSPRLIARTGRRPSSLRPTARTGSGPLAPPMNVSVRTFSSGEGSLQTSTLRKRLNTGERAAVPEELRRWVFSQGKKLPGLVRRRKAEGELFSQARYQ